MKFISKTKFTKKMEIGGSTYYPNVTVGKDVEVGENCIIGYPPIGKTEGELEVQIGEGTRILTNAIIYAGNIIGRNCFIGHRAYIRENNIFGDKCSMGTNIEIEGYSNFGDKVRMHTRTHVGQYTTIGNCVYLTAGVILTNDIHPPCGKCLKGATLEDYTTVCANATVMPRITLKSHCIVGAGAVVTKDVERETIVAGVPAKKIGMLRDIKCERNKNKVMPWGIYDVFNK